MDGGKAVSDLRLERARNTLFVPFGASQSGGGLAPSL